MIETIIPQLIPMVSAWLQGAVVLIVALAVMVWLANSTD